MYLFLIIGIVLGAAGLNFALQNTAPVTVSFFAWQFTAPLAFVILGSVAVGLVIAALMMVPRAVNEALDAYARRREARRQASEASYDTSAISESALA